MHYTGNKVEHISQYIEYMEYTLPEYEDDKNIAIHKLAITYLKTHCPKLPYFFCFAPNQQGI